MTLCFAHSTDAGDTTAASGLFDPAAQIPAIITTNPRWPAPYNNYANLAAFNTEGLRRILRPAEEDDLLIAGGAFRPNVASDGVSTSGLIRFFGDAGATTHITITLLSDGSVRARRGNGAGTILGTSAAGRMAFSTWGYLAAKVRLHDTTGTVDLEVNGQIVLSLTGQDTKNAGTDAVFDSASWGGAPGRDFYICNEQGTKNNDFLGDVRVTASFATSDSTPEEWDLSAGTDSFALVDEVTLDTTTYIESDVDGEITRFGMSDLPDLSHNVLGAQASAYAAKSDAGTRSFRMGIVSGSTLANSADFTLGTGFTTFTHIQELNPDGSTDWTPVSYNASLLQVEVRP